MGLFGKKKVEEPISDKSEEHILKEELETEVEKIQKEFRIKQDELNDITHKIKTVKEEYNYVVSNLMVVKKEINQKKMELDVVQREHREIKEKPVELTDDFKLKATANKKASITLVRLILAGGKPLSEKEIGYVIFKLTIFSGVLAIITAFMMEVSF